jgi:methionine synthase II (cobalamin-independent)
MHRWQPRAAGTLIGSMPHKDPETAISLVLDAAPEVPAWPQLSAIRAEQMMVQYLEGLPGVRDTGDGIFFTAETADFETEAYAFYESYLAVAEGTQDIASSRFRMGQDTARTFLQFLKALPPRTGPLEAVKGQVVGPFTLLAGLKNSKDRLLLYDERYQDLITKLLAMKAAWQIHHLRQFGCPVILFLDEPALAGYGSSAFISVSGETILGLLREVIEMIHQKDGLAGIHVCANTDWGLVFDSGVDVVNFDAYSYFDKFVLYRHGLESFMAKGGIVAWGMVPTNDPELIEKETAENLAQRWLHSVQGILGDNLTLSRVLTQSLFSPSCGCGSIPEQSAERVLILTRQLSRIMRKRLEQIQP